MIGQAFMGACVFGVISYLNFFVFSRSFFTLFTGIATAIVAGCALLACVMMMFCKEEEEIIFDDESSTEDDKP